MPLEKCALCFGLADLHRAHCPVTVNAHAPRTGHHEQQHGQGVALDRQAVVTEVPSASISYDPSWNRRRPWIVRLVRPGRGVVTHFEQRRETALAHVTRVVNAVATTKPAPGSPISSDPGAETKAASSPRDPGAGVPQEAR